MKIEDIKSIKEDAIRISECFKEYEDKIAKDSCDKHGIGFNVDDRFSGAGVHKISFDSKYGYYGSSSCYSLFGISSQNRGLFWSLFDKYVNEHKKDIFDFIAKGFESEISKHKEDILEEINRLNSFLEELNVGKKNE